jgi:hypothetical protein
VSQLRTRVNVSCSCVGQKREKGAEGTTRGPQQRPEKAGEGWVPDQGYQTKCGEGRERRPGWQRRPAKARGPQEPFLAKIQHLALAQIIISIIGIVNDGGQPILTPPELFNRLL